ncbi:MAG: chromophore lyase CpcT/CpeT [Jaaginema sp. PMC 1079.18]|nr:chromophore lyase CpcT/CpeT [Jaaginema sp. PMC 1080.18]MEC4853564.1 chromophore lyase CpcT/CpeT [Jaaginema sp. PMC 1079.18]MEC4868441.1 chromophore lyase CpcT/CpeT [Jaaginema sp. PMC 1078.18]
MKGLVSGAIALSILTAIAPGAIALPPASVTEVAQYLIGEMDTSTQAEQVAEMPSVRMTTCEVTVKGMNGLFLYQEQALTRNLSQPYRQRFLRLSLANNGETVESRSYKPQMLETWIGLCEKPQGDRVVEGDRLTDADCSVYLVPWHNLYIGHTQAGGCPANVRGAVTITNTVLLHHRGMDTWDRGFDTQGEQVWGAESHPYQYRRARF